MEVRRRALLGALGASAVLPAGWTAAAAAAPPAKIPPDTFAAKPAMDDLVLSPDGRTVLARMQVRGAEMLGTYQIATGELRAFTLPKGAELAWYRWAGNNRFLVSVSMKAKQTETLAGNLITVSIEGRARRLIAFDVATQAATFIGQSAASMEGDEVIFVDPAGEYVLLEVNKSLFRSPGVSRYSLADNESTVVERPMAGVYQWYADEKGVVRAGLGSRPDEWFLAYRREPGDPLRKVSEGKWKMFEHSLAGVMCFASGSDDGYILSNHENGFYAAYKFNFATQTIGERVFACPTNDVQSLDFSEATNALEAVHYTDERHRVAWFDPLLKEVQEGIDRAMPRRQNRIVSRSSDNGVMLVHSSTPRDPGTYYVFHLAETKLQRLLKVAEHLPPAQLSAMEPVRYQARDGLSIPAYLTLPAGREPKGLPLVILPHGGPYGVRDTLRFDQEVQFLANRGYAVLQPNYRGSDSYGIDFHRRGEGEWGRKMQDDLDDGMDWLVGRGIVDPKRACLVGGSYGGYAAAWGATRNPERYRCAAAFAGVFNLRSQLGYTRDFLSSRLYKQFREKVRGADTFDLDSVSPLLEVKRLQVPVLLVHGDEDTIVPVAQSKSYASALSKAGKAHEFHVIKKEGHGFRESGSLAFYLAKLDAFLGTHNPAG
jgi:dienelactone hydrolase